MKDGQLGLIFERQFERFNSFFDLVGAFVAPTEGEVDVDILWIELDGKLERAERVAKALHGSEGLPAEEQGDWAIARFAWEAVERLNRSLGQGGATIGGEHPAFAEHQRELEISFRFAEHLLPADTISR